MGTGPARRTVPPHDGPGPAHARPPGERIRRTGGAVLIGTAVASWAVVIASAVLFWVGIGICVVGAVVGKVLGMAGYGAKDVPAPGQTEQESGVR